MRVCDFRKLLVCGVLMVTLTLGIQAASPKDTALVTDLTLNPSGQTLEATIIAAQPARVTYFELDEPRRLVVDFHGLKNALAFSRKKVEAAGVEQIRTSYFSTASRKATRIVFDLAAGVNYQVVDDTKGTVRVVFGDVPPAQAQPTADQVPLNLVAGPPVLAAAVEAERIVPRIDLASLLSLKEGTPLPSAVPTQQVALLQEPAIQQVTIRPPVAPPAAVFPTLLMASAQITAVPIQTTPAITGPAQGQTFNGELVDLDLKDTDYKDFFRLIAEISGLNVMLDQNVSGTLTLQLKNIPWDQALQVVLRNYNLRGIIEGNVLRIATVATIQAEDKVRQDLRDAQANLAPMITRQYILNYTKAVDVAATLKASGALSARGIVVPENRRNAIIVQDVVAQFDNIEKMKDFIDVPSQQVEIEARLLAANKSFSSELGNQLGFVIGNNTGNVLTGGAGGSSPFARTPPPRATAGGSGTPLAANFAAAATSGLAFLLQAGGDIILDEIITAAEAKGTAKLMSRPKVTTQNNMAAEISQGTQIPVQTNVNNTISVSFLTFALRLNVTPQITEAGTILLSVEIENSQPDFARAVNGVPSVSTQKAKTQTLVPDGSTMMIGGIYVDTDSLNIRQVPGLGSVPLIGNLFKNTQKIKSQAELLFFITPRIKAADAISVAAPGN